MDVEIFRNEEFGEIRTIIESGKVLFCATDVASALGYAKPRNAISTHCKGALKRGILTSGGEQTLSFIPEGDVYRLIVRSKLPSAEKFERWVFDEVLPTIRKTGTYSLLQKPDSYTIDDPIERAKRWIEEKEAYLALENKVKEDEPYVAFAKHVTESSDTVDIGEFAKIVKNEVVDMGRNRLFAWLRQNEYLMKNNVPYQKYLDNGYFEVIETIKETAYGTKIFTKTLITGKGQIAIIERLRKEFGAAA